MTSENSFIWSGQLLCEARSASSSVSAQFYPGGETISGTGFTYTRDQVGSVREVSSMAGTLQSQYANDLFGRNADLLNNTKSDFRFGDYYFHPRSGLNLAVFRNYDSSKGRWLNRDPLEEQAGPNFYAYVGNSPADVIDSSGLGGFTWGNWGGQGYTNGGWGGFGENDPFRGSGATGSENNGAFQPPVDPLDYCAYLHDKCLNVCARVKDAGKRQCCRRNCDKFLSQCFLFNTYNWYTPFGWFIFGLPFSFNNNQGQYIPNLGPDPNLWGNRAI